MGAKAKIEGLTHAWYGFAVFSAIYSLLENGIGVFSIVGAAFGLVFSWIVTFFIGRALARKSSLTRLVLVVLSGVSSLFGVVATGKMAWVFVQSWQFGLLLTIAYAIAGLYMNFRSFRTLTDKTVKAYFA